MAATIVAILIVPVGVQSAPRVGFSEFASGLTAPTDIAAPGDGRLYVTEQAGTIKIIESNGNVSGTFLDIRDRVRSGGEEGLLGLALAPDYASSGRFFAYYTRHDGNNQLSSFVRTSPNHSDPSSETPILAITHPTFTNHNGGDLNFGANGFLYVATGDGGSAGDPGNNAQNTNSLLGKILRLDVTGDDFPSDGARNYAIPDDNPFVGDAGADEVWVYGLRNPWRFSFDLTTDDMFIGDVGQGRREEIDLYPANAAGGGNFGWRCYEGSLVFDFSQCSQTTEFTFPVAEYENDEARCAVTGGFVYRGSAYPAFRGDYFYIDFCSGELFSFKTRSGGIAGRQRSHGRFADLQISSFGQTPDGEIYAADLVSGKLYRLVGGR